MSTRCSWRVPLGSAFRDLECLVEALAGGRFQRLAVPGDTGPQGADTLGAIKIPSGNALYGGSPCWFLGASNRAWSAGEVVSARGLVRP